MKYTITIHHTTGMKTKHGTDSMAQAVVIWREEVNNHPDDLVELKYCKNYKDF